MYFYNEEYVKVVEAIKYYISKFINTKLVEKMNIRDFNIQKIKDNFYNFTYDVYFDDKSLSDIRFISGTISKKYVKLLAKKTLSATRDKQVISFTTIKIGEFILDNDEINYFDLYATIDKSNENEKIESTSHRQNYEFRCGKIDLLDNYFNLIAVKWPIINHDRCEMVKKLQKC